MSAGQVGVKRRRSRAAIEALVSEFEASGLSRKAFCASRGLSVASLDKYRVRVRKASPGARLLAVDVRPAEDASASLAAFSSVAVVFGNGRRIEIGSRHIQVCRGSSLNVHLLDGHYASRDFGYRTCIGNRPSMNSRPPRLVGVIKIHGTIGISVCDLKLTNVPSRPGDQLREQPIINGHRVGCPLNQVIGCCVTKLTY